MALMPKSLCDKIDDLENEIHVLLMLQEPGGGCNRIKGAKISTLKDGTVNKVLFDEYCCLEEEQEKNVPQSCCDNRPRSSPENCRRRNSFKCDGRPRSYSPHSRNKTCVEMAQKQFYLGAPPQVPPSCICGPVRVETPKRCPCGNKENRNAEQEQKNLLESDEDEIFGSRKDSYVDETGTRISPEKQRDLENKVEVTEKDSKSKNKNDNVNEIGVTEIDSKTKKEDGNVNEVGYTKENSKLKNKSGNKNENKGGVKDSRGPGGTFGGTDAESDGKDVIGRTKAQAKPNEKGDYEAIIAQLKAKISQLERKLAEAERNVIKTQTKSKSENEQVKSLKKEKDDLIKTVEQEVEQRKKSEKSSKQAVEKEKEKLKKKVEKIELNAVQSSKQFKSHGKQLVQAVQQRDDHIRRLSSTTEKLADNIRDREFENRKLSDANNNLVKNYMDAQLHNKKLAETNQTLTRNAKDMQDKLQLEKSKVEKMQKLMMDCKEECVLLKEEIDRLNEKLKQILKGPKDILALAKLQEKLREAREREQKYLEETEYIRQKLSELEEDKEQISKESTDELERIYREHKKLQNKYEELAKNFKIMEDECAKQQKKLEEDYTRQLNDLRQKFENLQNDRNELQKDFDELSDASILDRQVLEELIARTQKQDVLILAQQQAIAARDDEIEKERGLLEELQQVITEQQKQMEALNDSVQELVEAQDKAKKEIKNLNDQVEKEKAASLEKENIIKQNEAKIVSLNTIVDDQQEKIKNITEETGDKVQQEAKKAEEGLIKIDQSGDILTVIGGKVERVADTSYAGGPSSAAGPGGTTGYNGPVDSSDAARFNGPYGSLGAGGAAGLNETVVSYMHESSISPDVVAGFGGTFTGPDNTSIPSKKYPGSAFPAVDGASPGTKNEKQSSLVCCLEEKIILLQRESQLQLDLVLKQKMYAQNAARFATQQLVNTVDDFKCLLETHKDVQLVLQNILKDKEGDKKEYSNSYNRCVAKQSMPNAYFKMQCVNPDCITNKPGYS